jgi:hypothetical protein
MSSVSDKLLSIWCFKCDNVAQDGLCEVGRLCAEVADLDRAWRTFLLRLEVWLHPESADETTVAC